MPTRALVLALVLLLPMLSASTHRPQTHGPPAMELTSAPATMTDAPAPVVGVYNLVPASDHLAAWLPGNCELTSSTLTVPTGDSDGELFTMLSSTANSSVYRSMTGEGAAIGTSNVLSVHYQPDAGTIYARVMLIYNGGAFYSDFNITGTSVTRVWGSADDGYGSTVEANGWARLYVYAGPSVAAKLGEPIVAVVLYLDRRASPGVTNATGLWGVQFENGVTTPRAYQSTTGGE